MIRSLSVQIDRRGEAWAVVHLASGNYVCAREDADGNIRTAIYDPPDYRRWFGQEKPSEQSDNV